MVSLLSGRGIGRGRDSSVLFRRSVFVVGGGLVSFSILFALAGTGLLGLGVLQSKMRRQLKCVVTRRAFKHAHRCLTFCFPENTKDCAFLNDDPSWMELWCLL